MRVHDVVQWLKEFAPLSLAESWDNVGLLLGDAEAQCDRVLTCLTLTADVATEAIDTGCQMIVTHHPLPFKPVAKLTASDPVGKVLLPLLRNGVAVYSAHTAFDSCRAGINASLAEQIGLRGIKALKPAAGAATNKLVCFVPAESLADVQRAVWNAGAGIIGEYTCCSFAVSGTGSFLPSQNANPTVGSPGKMEHCPEVRLEVDVPAAITPQVVAALRAAHPYEEPAYDVYPLISDNADVGAGRFGDLPEAVTLEQLLLTLKTMFTPATLQVVGDGNRLISRIAVACGSGGEFLSAAKAQGCDLLLTGEARFHTAIEARDSGIGLVLAGHYATERPAMDQLAATMSASLPGLNATGSRVERDPLRMV